jgi:hypothetical protein
MSVIIFLYNFSQSLDRLIPQNVRIIFFLWTEGVAGNAGIQTRRTRGVSGAARRPASIQTPSLSSFTSCRQFTICPSINPSLSPIDAEPDADLTNLQLTFNHLVALAN